MTTVGYDLDTSGGLMAQIQALVAPPSSEDLSKKNKKQEKECRRPGRAVNHDCCDSCKEGGDLLCCDRCPAAFHLQCHDPPLAEDDLPSGEWICHRCRVSPKELLIENVTLGCENKVTTEEEDEETVSNSSNRSRYSYFAACRERANSDDGDDYTSEDEEDESPFQSLIQAASLMNPQQFQLPTELMCTTLLPGTSKRRLKNEGCKNAKKFAHELDNGIVPLPAKVCFLCNKSCRKAPLIQCDYCPLLYHQDCLDPPLTTLPTGRWMCPSHPENMLDKKLLKSVSMTERVKLWDKFNVQLDQHAVKLSFLKKIHRKNPPFRYKVKHSKRKAVKVPEAIKEQYKFPPPLLPKMNQVPEAPVEPPRPSSPAKCATLEDQEEWLSSVVSLQSSIARYLSQKQLQRTNGIECKTSIAPNTISLISSVVQGTVTSINEQSQVKSLVCKDLKTMVNGTVLSQDEFPNGPSGEINKSNGPISLLNNSSLSTANGELDCKTDIKVKTETITLGISKTKGNSADSTSCPNSIVRVTVPITSNPTLSAHQGKSILVNTVNKAGTTVVTKVLTSSSRVITPTTPKITVNSSNSCSSILTPRPQTLSSQTTAVKVNANVMGKVSMVSGSGANATPKLVTVATPGQGKMSPTSHSINPQQSKLGVPLTPLLNLNNTLQACIEVGDIELSKLDERLIHILAWQRLQQLLPPKTSNMPGKQGPLNGLLPSCGSTKVQARAMLCPLTGKGQPCPMPYRTLTIGTGTDMDVVLPIYGHCNFVSAKHACIFFDEMTKHYELLNYSEHGTTVNNVLYSCDFSDKNSQQPIAKGVVASVKNIISKSRLKKQEQKLKDRHTMSAHANEIRKPCSCKTSSSSLIGGSGAGWEGTALLHHGSYIKFGCLQFFFSITDYAT